MILKNSNKILFINVSLVFLIFLIDRISKIYVINLDKKLLSSEIYTSKFLNISLVWNEGIAFGLFSFNKENFYDILTGLIFLIIFGIIYISFRSKGFQRFSYLMILGGAFGNVFDRVTTRSVPDFIDFHVGNFHWFIFNIADIFITIGVIFMIIFELFINNQKIK
tara:strand:+ start:532 stop:1026 length:495 start_codon:yes stop_codon:yes gene_type:complete